MVMKKLTQCIAYKTLIKLASLIIAYMIWNICMHAIWVEKTIRIPVYVYNTPENMMVHTADSIQITVQGKQSALHPHQLVSAGLYINAHQCTESVNWIAIKESDISLPHNTHLVHTYPSTLAITTSTSEALTT